MLRKPPFRWSRLMMSKEQQADAIPQSGKPNAREGIKPASFTHHTCHDDFHRDCAHLAIECEAEVSVQIKRMYLDFIAREYATTHPEVQVLSETSKSQTGSGYVPWKKDKAFSLRWYLSLRGETKPRASSSVIGKEVIYRYDWAFGISLAGGFYWDWMKELPTEGALAIHLVLRPEPIEEAPEAFPVSAILSTLHPSRNTKSIWDYALPMAPRTAAEMAKTGATVVPALEFLSSGLMLGSNVLESYTGDQKNWFLYQFFDEKQGCPVVEWRINKKVLVEYGPLLRGSLFLSFHSPAPGAGVVQILLRPQIRYCETDDLSYIIPTDSIAADAQVILEVRPRVGKGSNA